MPRRASFGVRSDGRRKAFIHVRDRYPSDRGQALIRPLPLNSLLFCAIR